jgi:hypothetical protein
MASNFWGIPRTTHDLGFVLVLQPAGVESLAAACGDGVFVQIDSIRRAFAKRIETNP